MLDLPPGGLRTLLCDRGLGPSLGSWSSILGPGSSFPRSLFSPLSSMCGCSFLFSVAVWQQGRLEWLDCSAVTLPFIYPDLQQPCSFRLTPSLMGPLLWTVSLFPCTFPAQSLFLPRLSNLGLTNYLCPLLCKISIYCKMFVSHTHNDSVPTSQLRG